MKKRADLLLIEKNFAETRSKAQSMIMAGQVSVDGKKIKKSSETFKASSIIKVSPLHPEWVSRGSLKLLHALKYFEISVKEKICLDLGASTGGFTQVLLKNGAKKIYSLDVGTNQLHEKLKKEKKIVNLEKTNAKNISKFLIPEQIDLLVCDVSFISMKKVIEPSFKLLNKNNSIIIALIKPQFEAKKKEIKRGGIITDNKIHERICEDIKQWFIQNNKMKFIGLIKSPLKGPKGNIEFLICVKSN